MEHMTEQIAPALDEIDAMARAAVAALPAPYRDAAGKVALRVEDFAPDYILEEMGIEDAFELTGLYDGIPLTEKSVMDVPHGPDTIWLFRRASRSSRAGGACHGARVGAPFRLVGRRYRRD